MAQPIQLANGTSIQGAVMAAGIPQMQPVMYQHQLAASPIGGIQQQFVTTQQTRKPFVQRERFPGEDKCKIFVGHLPLDTTDAELRGYFGQFGEIVDSVIMVDKDTMRPRGFGFVTFKTMEAVNAVINKSGGHEMKGRQLQVRKYFPKAEFQAEKAKQAAQTDYRNPGNGVEDGSQHKGPMRIDPGLKIFVGGIAPGTVESDVEQYFSEFGKIIGVNMPRDYNTKNPRGFAFVGFEDTDAVEKATRDRFHQINGKTVEVKGCEEQAAYLQKKREYGHRNHQGRIHSTVPSVPSAIQTIGYNPQPQLTYQLQPAMQGLGAMQGQLQGLTGAAAGGYTVIPAGYSYDPQTGVIYQAALPTAQPGAAAGLGGLTTLGALGGATAGYTTVGSQAYSIPTMAGGTVTAAQQQQLQRLQPTADPNVAAANAAAAYGQVGLALGTYAQEGSAFGAQKPTVGLQQSAVTQLPAGSHATQLSGSEVIYAAGNALSASAGDASQVLNYQSVDAQQLSRSSASSRGFHPYGR